MKDTCMVTWNHFFVLVSLTRLPFSVSMQVGVVSRGFWKPNGTLVALWFLASFLGSHEKGVEETMVPPPGRSSVVLS